MGFLLVEEGVHFSDMHKGIYGQSLATQYGLWGSRIGIHRSLLETQAPQAPPQTSGIRTCIAEKPQVFRQALYLLRSKGLGMS